MKPPAALSELYVLDVHKEVIPAKTFKEWCASQGRADRTVASTNLGANRVLWTYFAGRRLLARGPLLTFQTVVTGVPFKFPSRYYETWADAWDGHAVTIAMLGRLLGIVTRTQRPLVTVLAGGKQERKPARTSARVQTDLQLRSNE